MYKWLKTEENVRLSIADKIARITLDRPAKRNALTSALIGDLTDALREADDRLDVSVIVIEGAGGNFSSGYDVNLAYGHQESPPLAERYRSDVQSIENDAWKMRQHLQPMTQIFDTYKPVIAKIEGHCLAGGCELALLCDILLAANDASLGHPGVRGLGSPPNNFWLYHVGPQWAKRMLLTGDTISGRDAATIGMVLAAYSAEELEQEVVKLAEQMARIDPELLAANKRAVNLGMELAGARSMMNLTVEIDARSHAAQGPQRAALERAIAQHGPRQAFKDRDNSFGNSRILLGKTGHEDDR